jgi:hypothetical protein
MHSALVEVARARNEKFSKGQGQNHRASSPVTVITFGGLSVLTRLAQEEVYDELLQTWHAVAYQGRGMRQAQKSGSEQV